MPILVWDVMVNYGPSGQYVDPDLAYVTWEEPQTVRLVRAMLPLPVDFTVAVKEVPFVHRLLPQKMTVGQITLPIPVQEYNPFFPAPNEVRNIVCTKVRLIIGWTEEKPGMVVSTREVGGQSVLALRGGWTPPIQLWEEATLDCTVPLAVRCDRFDRRLPMQ